jgi:hypothetical protein
MFFIANNYNILIILQLNKGIVDAGVHFEHGRRVRRQIKPRLVERC